MSKYYCRGNDKNAIGIRKRRGLMLAMLMLAVLLTGCTRAEMNEQIAESIGTLGQYENNEPVETPKMRAEREMEASKQAVENNVTEHVTIANRLAASYDYSAALEELAKIEPDYQDDERVISAKIEFQRLQGLMVNYKGDIPHLSFKTLVVDPGLAYDDDDMGVYFNYWTLTTTEFERILESLYERNYILMNIEDVVVEVENEDGTTSFALNNPAVPRGKTPMIFSFAEANYYDSQKNNGFSNRMVLDEDGSVQNEYRDAEGNTSVGAYDIVPILDEFVEKHPDFSLRGAKGIISVTGYQGVFGYGIETGATQIREIADALKANGWRIACHGYSNSALDSELDNEEFVEDIETWEEKVGSLVGNTNLLIYPYGEDLAPEYGKHTWLLEQGFQYFFSIWTTADWLEVNPTFIRQSRRTLDGYDLYLYKEELKDFFDVDQILEM
ncbi:MAG: hypothetical protein Q4B57_03185, partial [Eubacteriales bacterium]|nr:hypothetical protein [Eubacteriales bacterium]